MHKRVWCPTHGALSVDKRETAHHKGLWLPTATLACYTAVGAFTVHQNRHQKHSLMPTWDARLGMYGWDLFKMHALRDGDRGRGCMVRAICCRDVRRSRSKEKKGTA